MRVEHLLEVEQERVRKMELMIEQARVKADELVRERDLERARAEQLFEEKSTIVSELSRDMLLFAESFARSSNCCFKS